MGAAVAPFRRFFRDPLKKNATAGPRAKSIAFVGEWAQARFEKLSRAPSSRFASEKSAARPGRGRLLKAPMKDEGGSVNPLGFRLFAPGRSGNVARGRYAEHAFWKRRARARCF